MNKQGILTKEQPPEFFEENGVKYVRYRTLSPGDHLDSGEKLRGKNAVYKPEALPLTTDRKNQSNKREPTNPPYIPPKDNYIFSNAPFKPEIGTKRHNQVTTSAQDEGANWGIYARQFDEVMRGAGGRIDKREVANSIGLLPTCHTFRVLLNRRKAEGKVRTFRGSHYLIEWINRDYVVTKLSKANIERPLDIALPFGADEYIAIPPKAVIVIAGDTDGGKTSLLLELAELNVFTQPRPIYYWYNEMSEAKLIYRCEDYPKLIEAQGEGVFYPVQQGDFEFKDVLQPDGINLVDYVDRDDALYLIGEDIRQLYDALGTGVVVLALQKKPQLHVGYGGGMSIKRANLYITLDKLRHGESAMYGRATIRKCKDWKDVNKNPNGLACDYHSGGLHGKLFKDGEWRHLD